MQYVDNKFSYYFIVRNFFCNKFLKYVTRHLMNWLIEGMCLISRIQSTISDIVRKFKFVGESFDVFWLFYLL